jgi:hypothetical protein
MITLTIAQSEVRDAVERLVDDIVAGRFQDLEADGRLGTTTAGELRNAVLHYGRTITHLPSEAWRLVDEFFDETRPDEISMDVPLWTVEEGRSDLTLSVSCRRDRTGISVAIEDLHVL